MTLAYDVTCPLASDQSSPTGNCPATGTVHVTAGSTNLDLPLSLRLTRTTRSYEATLPSDILVPGLAIRYWADLSDPISGEGALVPAGGAAAPTSLTVVSDPVTVALPSVFETPVAPTQVLATGSWGAEDGQFGVARPHEGATVGPSAFDIEPDGTVDVLDDVNGRVVKVASNGATDTVPLAMDTTRSDFALEANGTFDVLEESGAGHRPELLRFSPSGKRLSDQDVPGETATAVRPGPDGPLVYALPSEQWLPALNQRSSTPVSAPSMAAAGSVARPTAGGSALTVKVTPTEVRVLETGGGTPRRVWRLTSNLPIGEYQAAELRGQNLLVVIRQYDDSRSQFRVLEISPAGELLKDFVVQAEEFAETSPQSEFRVGPTGDLYQAASTKTQFSILRYSLGGQS